MHLLQEILQRSKWLELQQELVTLGFDAKLSTVENSMVCKVSVPTSITPNFLLSVIESQDHRGGLILFVGAVTDNLKHHCRVSGNSKEITIDAVCLDFLKNINDEIISVDMHSFNVQELVSLVLNDNKRIRVVHWTDYPKAYSDGWIRFSHGDDGGLCILYK